MDSPKVLLFDIETSPIVAHVWGLYDQNIGLNQIVDDWSVLSWSAKWLGDSPSKIMYQDTRNQKCIREDKKILKGIWDLLHKADIVITQNGRKFDAKKLNARFIKHGFKPTSSYKHIDTLVLAKRYFGFTSNKLEYMTELLCTKYKKLKHKKFPGMELWSECLKNNIEAWQEMEEYNKHDVLALEELYAKLITYDTTIDFNMYSEGDAFVCKCGSTRTHRRGYTYTDGGKYQKFRCNRCGSETRGKTNMLTKEKKLSLRKRIVR